MKCPYCSYGETKVIDSRESENGSFVRRRRECIKCSKGLTTYREIEKDLEGIEMKNKAKGLSEIRITFNIKS